MKKQPTANQQLQKVIDANHNEEGRRTRVLSEKFGKLPEIQVILDKLANNLIGETETEQKKLWGLRAKENRT